jgi:hypothetical protein
MDVALRRLDRLRTLACALVVVALAATLGSGCGTQSTPSRPAKSASADDGFVAQADAICTRLSRDITDPPGTVLTPKTLALLAPKHAALERGANKALASLRPPDTIRADWEKILRYRGVLAVELDALGHAAAANDSAAIKRLARRKKQLYSELSVLAKRIGIAACGKAGNTVRRRGESRA